MYIMLHEKGEIRLSAGILLMYVGGTCMDNKSEYHNRIILLRGNRNTCGVQYTFNLYIVTIKIMYFTIFEHQTKMFGPNALYFLW